jgi:hypothetical protein
MRWRALELTPQNAQERLATLVPGLQQSGKDDASWEFSARYSDGLVRTVSLTFRPEEGAWHFGALGFDLKRSDGHKRLLAEARELIRSKLGKPTWNNESVLAFGWALDEPWELSLVAMPSLDEVSLSVAEPEGP